MKRVFVYQIIDSLSENVLQNFIGPNDKFAESVFHRFLQSDGMKNVDVSDLYLIACNSDCIFESHGDYQNNADVNSRFICSGDEIIPEVN